jgi:hypothetical protein
VEIKARKANPQQPKKNKYRPVLLASYTTSEEGKLVAVSLGSSIDID